MKKITKVTIQKMSFAEKSKLAHKIAKQLEGNYNACLKLAWEYITFKRKQSTQKINNLLSLTKQANKAKQVNKAGNKKQAPKQPKKQKEKEIEPLATINDYTIPANIFNILELEEIESLDTYIKNRIEGKRTNNKGNTYNYGSGMYLSTLKKAIYDLSQATSRQHIQMITLFYFLDIQAYKTIKKIYEMGINYKKAEKETNINEAMEKFSKHYNSKQLSDGKILDKNKDDIFNMLVSDSGRLHFKKLFDNNLVGGEIYVRTMNTLRTDFNRNKSSVKINNVNQFTNEEKGIDEEKVFSQGIKEYTVEERSKHYEGLAEKLLDVIPNITDYEIELFKLQLNGMSKKEIALSHGKSQNAYNRTFKAMEQKIQDYLGIDAKEYKKNFISTKRKLA